MTPGHECESWIIKKAKRRRINDFELWCWRVSWIARRRNQSILKEISPEYSLERLMLKLKLQYFGHLMRRTDSLEKTLMLGKIEGRRRRGRQRTRRLDGIADSRGRNLTKLQKLVKDREAWRAAVHGVSKSRIRLSKSAPHGVHPHSLSSTLLPPITPLRQAQRLRDPRPRHLRRPRSRAPEAATSPW